jgi:hypothetical protein
MNNCCICWFSRIYLLRILIFKGVTAPRLYKSFGVKGLIHYQNSAFVDLSYIYICVCVCVIICLYANGINSFVGGRMLILMYALYIQPSS